MFGQTAATSTGAGGFTFNTAASAVAPAQTSGFGGTGTLGNPGGFSFGATPASTTSATTGSGLFAAPGQKSVRFDTPSSSSTLSSLLSSTPSVQPLTGLGLAATSTGTSGGLLLGTNFAAGNTTTASTLGGLLSATPASSTPATSGFSLGGLSGTAATSTGTGLFGTTLASGTGLLGSTLATSTGILGSTPASSAGIFGSTPATSATLGGLGGQGLVGLGGVVSSASGSATGAAKTSDAKALKDTPIPPEIQTTVDEFTKHVKSQKEVRENIARMSSKPLFRIQDDMKNLRQQLSIVTSGLQRNAATIEKLKRETHQELKHAEIAVRTRETPPGLQYENTAPTEYFQRLAEEFENQMQIYRQQIVETENHLASAQQSSNLTPQDLSLLLNKLNEGFIALAAQLQVTHEAVKEQKELYLGYRRIFLGDSSNVFNPRTQNSTLQSIPVAPTTVGPTPFSHMSNSAAVAMAAALNRTQPSAGTGGYGLGNSLTAPSAGGSLTLATSGSLFGHSTGSTGLGISGGSAATQPFSFSSNTGGTGTTSLGTGMFGSSNAASSPFAATATVSPFGSSLQNPSTGLSGFALQKTPSGSKRGKNA